MPQNHRTIAIVLAAGMGRRAGGPTPKQYQRLGGRSVVDWSLDAFAAHKHIDDTVLVVPPSDAPQWQAGSERKLAIVTGGATRRQSVRNALEALDCAVDRPDWVLIHDAARPGLSKALIDRLLAALADGQTGAIPVLPVADTLVWDDDGAAGAVAPRDLLRRVQTPQAFQFGAILAAHRQWVSEDEPTDDAQMVRAAGQAVMLIEGDGRLDKITMPSDLGRMERLLMPEMETRTGTGFDVHRLVEGEPLWLCGVKVQHSHGLAGHSDADVAIHALVDALLGALAEGDIGTHFPPSDPKWRGAPSSAFLRFAAERVASRGGRIVHVDVTIICEAPKIGPHRATMRQALAALLGIAESRASVKATTTERLGFTGRGEGIAAQAAATISLPLVD